MKQFKRLFRIKKSIIILFISFVTAISLITDASADYYITNTELGTQGIPKTYTVSNVIGSFGGTEVLANPIDLFIDDKDNLYILDSGNSRILVLDEDGKFLREISDSYGKDSLSLNNPGGIYVDEIGDIFIADTGNARILHLNSNGGFIEEFFQPKEDTYDTSYPFKPSKVYLDSAGKLYTVNDFDWHGIIVMDGENRFLGYIGGSKIGFSLTDWFVRIFATKAQKEQLARETPPYFSNFLINEGLIYTTSYWEDKNQIKKLTPAGDNIFPKKLYGEMNEKTNFNERPGFVDLAVDKKGIVYAADMVVSKIYVYDQEGNNLAVFGGEGRRKGYFNNISSIAVNSKGDLYILDRITGLIQVFTPTELMRNIIAATTCYNEGQYEAAIESLNMIQGFDSTNYFANIALAKVQYRLGNTKKAMALYRMSFNKSGYSDVFGDYRIDWVRNNFLLLFIGILSAMFLATFGFLKLKKYADATSQQTTIPDRHFGFKGYVRLGVLMIFHPIDCCDGIKANRKKLTYWPVIILTAAIILARIIYLFLVHFPLADLNAAKADLWQQVAMILIPLFSWIIVCFLISSISEGKQTFLEALFSSLFSFLPYIVLTIPLGLLSRCLTSGERGLFELLSSIILMWSIGLLLLSCKLLNQYSFGKLVGLILKTIFGILCLWMITMLFYIVVYQSFNFFKSIYTEFNILINR